MKYIITKDGIYRNASVSTDLVIICRDRECEVNPSDIINQADTIEELCDEYRYGEHKLCYMYDKNVWLDCETDLSERYHDKQPTRRKLKLCLKASHSLSERGLIDINNRK